MLPAIAAAGLAAALIASGAVLAAIAEQKAARATIVAGIVSAVAAVGLAITAEVQYRDCTDKLDAQRRDDPLSLFEKTGSATGGHCERWPFSSDPE